MSYHFVKVTTSATVVLLFVSVALLQAQSRPSLPNVVVILADDLGLHDVSYAGTKDIQTPAIDRLATDGMRFTNFYSNSTVCSPTRASLLTGLYPDQAGVPGVIRTDPGNSWGYLSASVELLPSMLKRAGYHTALIGKWHLGLESPNTPVERGFDYFKGWLGDMMDDYYTHRRHGINYMRLNETPIDPPGHATDLFTDWSAEYIQQQASRKQPFFLFLAYNAPHFPVQPPNEYLDRVRKRNPELSEDRSKLVAFIEHLDAGIGNVIQVLKQTGLYDNTLVLFTSDNGGFLPNGANNGPFRGGKESMYEGGLRVPMVATWPAKIKANTATDDVHLTMDVVPTLLDITGVNTRNNLSGRSFLKAFSDTPSGNFQQNFYFVRREGGKQYIGQCIYAVRMGDWKLVKNSPQKSLELFNLRTDPMENVNRANENPEIYEELCQFLMSHIQMGGAMPWQKTVSK